MALTDYTSYAEVRAVLGVSATELPDTVLALTQYALVAVLELEDVNLGIPALYTTVAAISSNPSKTATQQRFYDLVRLFVAYAVAQNLLTSLPLFSVKQLTDGKSEFQRQANIFEEVRAGVEGLYTALKTRLSTVYVLLEPTAVVYSSESFDYTTAIGIAVNPMTSTVV